MLFQTELKSKSQLFLAFKCQGSRAQRTRTFVGNAEPKPCTGSVKVSALARVAFAAHSGIPASLKGTSLSLRNTIKSHVWKDSVKTDRIGKQQHPNGTGWLQRGEGGPNGRDSGGLAASPKLGHKHSLCSATEMASFGAAHPLQSYKER